MLVNIYESLFYFEDFQEVVMRTPAEIQNIMELCDEDSEVRFANIDTWFHPIMQETNTIFNLCVAIQVTTLIYLIKSRDMV